MLTRYEYAEYSQTPGVDARAGGSGVRAAGRGCARPRGAEVSLGEGRHGGDGPAGLPVRAAGADRPVRGDAPPSSRYGSVPQTRLPLRYSVTRSQSTNAVLLTSNE